MLRIAPSPTGHLHLGNLYVFFFVSLWSESFNEKILLRVDDTDQKRNHPDWSLSEVRQQLKYWGITTHMTFCQSHRKSRHLEVARDLLKAGMAVEREGALRISGTGTAHDLFRGDKVQNREVVLVRSDGSPTYHLANCVDDWDFVHLVVRAEEWLQNSPMHAFVWQCMNELYGQQKNISFVHLPLLRVPGGKMSKREGAQATLQQLSQKVHPEAVKSFLFSLFTAREAVFSRKKQVNIFKFFVQNKKFKWSSPLFDEKKLLWYNKQFLKTLPKPSGLRVGHVMWREITNSGNWEHVRKMCRWFGATNACRKSRISETRQFVLNNPHLSAECTRNFLSLLTRKDGGESASYKQNEHEMVRAIALCRKSGPHTPVLLRGVHEGFLWSQILLFQRFENFSKSPENKMSKSKSRPQA